MTFEVDLELCFISAHIAVELDSICMLDFEVAIEKILEAETFPAS